MDQIKSNFQLSKERKYAAIRQEYAEMAARGGQKMAVYQILADKYGYTEHHIRIIIKDNAGGNV